MYVRFVETKALSEQIHQRARQAILEMDMPKLALILNDNLAAFEETVIKGIAQEQGQALLKSCVDTIFDNIQMKLSLNLGNQ